MFFDMVMVFLYDGVLQEHAPQSITHLPDEISLVGCYFLYVFLESENKNGNGNESENEDEKS